MTPGNAIAALILDPDPVDPADPPVRRRRPRRTAALPPSTLLTRAECSVLQAAANGLTADQAAAELGYSVPWVKQTRMAACRKLGALNGTHGVVLALQAGLIDWPPTPEEVVT